MAFDIAAAKEAGYSDEEISAYQQAEAEKNKRATAITTAVGDPPAPTTIVPEVSGGLISPTGGMTTALAVAAGAAGVGVPAAILYGAKKIFAPAAAGAGQLAERGVSAIEEGNQIARMKEQGLQQRAAARAVPQAAAPAAAPVRPTAILDQYGRPMAPPAAAPVAPQPLSQQVQQAAASRITNMPAAAPGMMARAGSVAGKLLPGAGTALNAYDAYNRYQQGDMVGAGISGAAAAASPFPVLGTAVGLGALAANQARDYFGLTPPRKKPQP